MLARIALALVLVAALLAAAPLPAADPEPAAAEIDETSKPRTLFDRLGGTYVLARLVDDFVDAMLVNPVVRDAAVRDAIKPAHKAGLKFQITSLLCQETGGPCKYQGKTLREAHMGMAISARQWGAMLKDFKAAMVRAKVPAAEQQELTTIVSAGKGDIVTTTEK